MVISTYSKNRKHPNVHWKETEKKTHNIQATQYYVAGEFMQVFTVDKGS